MPIDIERSIERIPFSGCWVWTGNLSSSGYALGKPDGVSKRIHRWVYEQTHWPVGNLVLDHLCRVRCCINPNHMEVVTAKENVLRGEGHTAKNAAKTHCINGHPFDQIVKRKDGSTVRRCSTCNKRRSAESKRRNRENNNV